MKLTKLFHTVQASTKLTDIELFHGGNTLSDEVSNSVGRRVSMLTTEDSFASLVLYELDLFRTFDHNCS